MARKSLCLLLASVLLAYYVYSPVPENVEERWKLMLFNLGFRAVGHVVSGDVYYSRGVRSFFFPFQNSKGVLGGKKKNNKGRTENTECLS